MRPSFKPVLDGRRKIEQYNMKDCLDLMAKVEARMQEEEARNEAFNAREAADTVDMWKLVRELQKSYAIPPHEPLV